LFIIKREAFKISGKSFKLPHRKDAAEVRTKKIATPKIVIISTAQGIGVPCTPVVEVGDNVKTGQLIADSEAFISAPVYSSVTGKVSDIKDIEDISGRFNKAIVIESESQQVMCETIAPPVIENRADFIKAVRKSGLVGLGGAGFPAHVKIGFDPEKFKVDTLLINGAECEPYVATDSCEFMENAENIIKGIKLIMKYCEIPRAIIGIEKKNPKAIRLMRELIEKDADNYPDSPQANITVKRLGITYPQGAEKVLIYSAVGRVVREGQLPLAAGCLIVNVSSAAFIAKYVETGIPLIYRRVTIDGNIVNKPANLLMPIGTTLGDIISQADLRLRPDRIIFGGPMMGRSVYDMDTPISKTTGAVLFFKGFPNEKITVCIRCGKCVRACFMKLLPTEIENAYKARDTKQLMKLNINSCMECGSCSYICPAKRNLAETNKLAKDLIRKSKSET